MSAVIDVVSMVERLISDEHNTRVYVATLTYFYRNPELQMGEFERQFGERSAAKAWVGQFKGRSVMVHVNPANGADSALLESELAGLELHGPAKNDAPTRTLQFSEEEAEALSPGYRLLCGVGELVSTAGLGTSAVLLAASVMRGGRMQPLMFYWVGGAMLAVSLAAVGLLYFHLRETEAGRTLLKTYSKWAPAWLGWSLKGTGTLVAIVAPFFHLFRASFGPLLRPIVRLLAPHFVYLLGVWLFLLITAFLAAILRSQEELRMTAPVA